MNADTGSKVNPGYQRNIQDHTGTKKGKGTIKKMQGF